MILKLSVLENERRIKELLYNFQGEIKLFFVNFLINHKAIYHDRLLVKSILKPKGYQREDPNTNQYFV
jgi:hypothetical protein